MRVMLPAMSGIGLVMFGKALIVTLWAIAAELWQAYRKRRIDAGLPLKQGAGGVYRVSDWTIRVDTAARWGREVFIYMAFAWWAFLLFGYFVMGRPWLTAAISKMFFS